MDNSSQSGRVSLAKPEDESDKLVLKLTFVDDRPIARQELFRVFCEELASAELRNGRASEPYIARIKFDNSLRAGWESLGITVDDCRDFEELGLRCRANGRELLFEGTPQRAFEGYVEISPFFKQSAFNRKLRSNQPIRIPFSILPDPYSLWKKKDPPKDAPYRTPHEEYGADVLKAARPLTILAASKRGRSHAHEGKFRDDNFYFKTCNGSVLSERVGWSAFAVADGAGSAKYSRMGSKIACNVFVDKIYEALNLQSGRDVDEAIVGEIEQSFTAGNSDALVSRKLNVDEMLYKIFHQSIHAAYTRINEEARNRADGSKTRDFATTALFVVVKPFQPRGESTPIWAIVSYWIGDGALAVYRPNQREVLLLGTPDSGEYAGQTRFLTMTEEIAEKPICERLRLTLVRDFKALVMATDGISDPFFTSDSKLNDFDEWKTFWNETLPREFPGVLDAANKRERAKALLAGLEFKVPGNHDDRTLLMLINDQQ